MPTRSAGVRGLVFGSLMAALIVLCAMVPFLGIFLPIPLVLTYLRYGGRMAVLTAVVASIFSTLFVGPVQAFLMLVPGGVLPGLAFGYGFRHQLKPMIIALVAGTVFVVGFGASYTVTRSLVTPGRDPLVEIFETGPVRNAMDRTFEWTDRQLNQAPARTEQEKQSLATVRSLLTEQRQNPIGVAWTLMPAILLMTAAFSTWFNYMLCRWILPRFGHAVPQPTPFAELRLPVWLSLVFPLLDFALKMYIGPSQVNAHWSVKVLLNVVQPLTLVFVLVGVAVAYGYLRTKMNLSKAMAVGLCVATMLLGQIALQVYMMIAMWDSLFDFRGLGHGVFKRPTENP